MKRLSSLLMIMVLCVAANAQTLKFGHIDANTVVELMPERDSAIIKLQNLQAQLYEELEEMQVEYNNKVNTFNQKKATWTPAILENKQQELVDMGQRIEKFNQDASAQMQAMQNSLFAPILKKVQDAIDKIAKENGYVYVMRMEALVYVNDQLSTNLLPMVKAELGIPADKTTPTQIPESAPAQ